MNKKRLTLDERKVIQDKLPVSISYGYDLIEKKLAEKGIRLERQRISQAFTIDNRYNADVFDAAIEVIQEETDRVDNQRKMIHQL